MITRERPENIEHPVNKPNPMAAQILTQKAVAEYLGVCVNTFRKHFRSDPTFPRRRVFGRGLEGYLLHEVEEWVANCPAPVKIH